MVFRRRRSFFDEFFDELERVFEDFMREPFVREPFKRRYVVEEETGYREPLSDVWEKEDEVIAVIELPGVDKEDIDLNVTPKTLEVRAEKKEEKKEKEKGTYFEERAYKGYYLTLSLPAEVDPNEVKATYKNGVLEVRMKKAKQEEKKKIKIE